MSLTLSSGTVVVSLNPTRLVNADVVVDDGRVTSVGQAGDRGGRIDCGGCLVVPGNVCAHTHLYSSLARGMPYKLAAPTSFVEILQRVWWRLDRALDEEAIRASALLGGMEALLAGTTTLFDHHASPNAVEGSLDVIAEALEDLGCRSVLCYEVSDRDGAKRARAGIEENGRFLRRSGRLTRGMVGAHASFTLSEETLAGCVEVAREHRAGIHIHVAEDDADERDAVTRFGKRVAERLADGGALRHDALLAHCVRLDRKEAEIVRQSGATVVHNPRSNMNNGVGRAPVGSLGARVTLGTDGVDGDLFREAQAAYLRRREDDLGTTPAWVVRRLAEGARLAGQAFGERSMGAIEPGAPADLVVLEYESPTPVTEANLPAHWVFAFGARHVRDVLVDGEPVVRDRRLTRVDQDKVVAEASAQAERLWRRTEAVRSHSFAPRMGK